MVTIKFNDPIETVITDTTRRINIELREGNPPVAVAADGELRLTVFRGSSVVHKDGFPSFTMTGTVSITAATAVLTGVGTKFNTEATVGDTLTVAAEPLVVLTVDSDTQITFSANHTAGAAGATATKTTRIVNPGVGSYYMLWGDAAAPINLPDQTEVNTPDEFLFVWQAVGTSGTEEASEEQTVKVITPRTAKLLHPFRTLVDKSSKLVDNSDVDNPCFLGYTKGQLLDYLEQGLHLINSYEPYPVFCNLDAFPSSTFGHVLFKSGLVAGVLSQQLFAIDTDVPNYSDQGNTFVIQHGPQLAAFLNQITAQLDKQIPLMKLKFVNSGALHFEAGTNFRLAQLVNAAPSGALFRNLFFAG